MQSNQPTRFAANFKACVQRDIHMLMIGKGNSLANRILVVLTNRGFHAVFNYRLANACIHKKIPLLHLLFTRVTQILYGIDIAPEADLGPGIVIVHGVGVVIGSASRIEGDCCIFHGVTLGDRGSQWIGSQHPDGHPYLEKAVMIGAGAKLLGPIRIGFSSVIGANSVVSKDVPSGSIAAGLPAKVVGTCEKNYFVRD